MKYITSTVLRRFGVALSATALACTSAACTTALGVQPTYVTASTSNPIAGRATLVMAKVDRDQVITSGPTSMTGAATSVTIPIGEVINAVGEKVCAAYFTDGASSAPTPAPGAYTVSAKLVSFSYKYDQLSNLGMAVTPKVSVALSIGVADASGTPITPERRYERTDYSATGAYLMSLHPAEKINQSAHMAIADLFKEALNQFPRTAGMPAPSGGGEAR